MPPRLRCAVIGAGNMGRHHIRTLAGLGSEAALVAICDRKEIAGQDLAGQHSAAYYADYLDMLRQEELDMVSICVPTRIHHQVGKDCIDAGLHVLLEKPICHGVEEAEELLHLAESRNIALLVGHTERFNPAVIKAKEIIDSGAIGEIIHINASRLGGFPARLEDNDVAFDLAIHDIDIVNLLLDDYPSRVSIEKSKVYLPDQEDHVEFSLQYATATADITASWTSPGKIRKLQIVGSGGSLELDYIDQEVTLCTEQSGMTSKRVLEITRRQPLQEEIKHLMACIRNKRKIDSRFAAEALRIATHDDGKVRSWTGSYEDIDH